MTHESDKIREVIVRLSLSGLPPTLQEGVISRVGDLSVSQLDEILAALTAFDQTQEQYLGQIDRFNKFFQSLTQQVELKQREELSKIEQELHQELAQKS